MNVKTLYNVYIQEQKRGSIRWEKVIKSLTAYGMH